MVKIFITILFSLGTNILSAQNIFLKNSFDSHEINNSNTSENACKRNWFNEKEELPFLTKEDSFLIFEYVNKHKLNINPNLKFNNFVYLLPRIREQVNIDLYDKLIANKSIYYKELNWIDIINLIQSDAIIVGRVIDKKENFKLNHVYFYKTDYYIIVEEVIHAYFPVQKGDTVLVKSSLGICGTCDPNQKIMMVVSEHEKDFKINERQVFMLEHNSGYYMKFLKIYHTGLYDDQYCRSAFEVPTYPGIYTNDSIKLTKWIDLYKDYFESIK